MRFAHASERVVGGNSAFWWRADLPGSSPGEVSVNATFLRRTSVRARRRVATLVLPQLAFVLLLDL
eukprot:6196065-Pleurochrysis_carterae.AAC.3